LWRAAVCGAVLLLAPAPAPADMTVRADKQRWQVTIPDDWAVASEEWLSFLNQQADSMLPGNNFRYLTGLFPNGRADSGVPYILLQVTETPLRGATYEELEKALNAEELSTAISGNTDLKAFTQGLKLGECRLDRANNRFVMSARQYVPGAGNVRMLVYGFLGRDCMMQLNCYTGMGDDPARYLDRVIASAGFDKGAAFVSGESSFDWSKVWKRGLIGGGIGCAVAVFAAMKRKMAG
jgi:hypothetical protein